jgi:Ca2+-binding EF-hand superfamily protein
VDKGFVDPMIAQCCQHLSKVSNAYDLSFEQIFDIFDLEGRGKLKKDAFIKCIQGMELGIAGEDLIEFFNFIDEKGENIIKKL